LGYYEKALNDCDKALKIKPDLPEVFLYVKKQAKLTPWMQPILTLP
jgi:lipoprotein NlpI